MRLQLPTIICVSLSLIVVISMMVLMRSNDDVMSRESLNLESEEFKSMREQARLAYNAKKYQQAIQIYEDALRLRPENAEVYNDLGATYYDFGLEHAGPSWPSWESDLAGKTPEEAVQELETAVEQIVSGYIVMTSDTPAVTEAVEAKAKELGAYVYTKQFGDTATINILVGKTKELLMKARNAYLRAIDIKPTYSPAYRNLGSLYMKIGQSDKAVDFLQKAYRLDPRDKELEQYLNQFR